MIKPQTLNEGVNPAPFTFGTPPAQSCVVDNFSQSYLFIADAGAYVPPMSTRTVGLPFPQSTVTVLWQTPPNMTAPQAGHGTAVILWSDIGQTTTQSTNYPSPGPAQFLGTYKTTNTGTFSEDGPFQIPPGTQSILCLYPNASLGPHPANIAIVGNQTMNQIGMMPVPQSAAYELAQGNNGLAWTQIFPSGAGDTTFSVLHEDADVVPQTVRVIAILTPLPLAVSAELDPTQTLAVDISGPISGGAVAVSQSGAPWSVSQSGAPWSVNLNEITGVLTAYPFTITDVASPVQIVAAAPPGIFHLYAYDITLDINGATVPCNGQFSLVGATSGKEILRQWYEAQTATGPNTVPHITSLPESVPLPQAEALNGRWTSVANHVQAIGTLWGKVI